LHRSDIRPGKKEQALPVITKKNSANLKAKGGTKKRTERSRGKMRSLGVISKGGGRFGVVPYRTREEKTSGGRHHSWERERKGEVGTNGGTGMRDTSPDDPRPGSSGREKEVCFSKDWGRGTRPPFSPAGVVIKQSEVTERMTPAKPTSPIIP